MASPESCSEPSADGPPLTFVVMGVSGVGKSSVAAELVARTGWEFIEGDDLHPESNRRKMASGHPLGVLLLSVVV